MASFKRKYPLLCSVFVCAAFYAVMLLTAVLLGLFFPGAAGLNAYTQQAILESYTALLAIALLAVFGYWRVWRERREPFGRSLLVGLYFAVVSVYSFFVLLYTYVFSGDPIRLQSFGGIVSFVLCMALIGFTEEVLFRGVVANLFWDKYASDRAGIWRAVILSGAVFGLMHLSNIISGSDPGSIMVQAVAASAMGMALTAVYYRTRNIWANVFLHALIDFCALFTSGFFRAQELGSDVADALSGYTGLQFLSAIPYVILTMVLLRRSRVRRLLGRWELASSPASKRGLRRDALIVGGIVLAIVVLYFVLYGASLPTLAELVQEYA